jgi:hypothetical protein
MKSIRSRSDFTEPTPVRVSVGNMIVIRLQNREKQKEAFRRLVEMQRKLGICDKFAVILDDSKERQCHGPDSVKQRVQSASFTYSSLERIPCILLLCKKGGFGDTFPKSLLAFDLRARYRTNVVASTFLQDAGRCFG